MSDLFLYPCSCGNKIEVAVRDAGTVVDCPKCDSAIELPGLRDLRKLELAADASKAATAKNTTSSWTREKGILFAIGLGAVIFGSIAAAIFFWIGYGKYRGSKPKIAGQWQNVSDGMPPAMTQVWAYTPEPAEGEPSYRLAFWESTENSWILAIFDEDSLNWRFIETSPRRPKEFFTKWGDSLQSGFEATVENSGLDELWQFWYETDPGQPLPEWVEPAHVTRERYTNTFYVFAAICGSVAAIGLVMVVLAVRKK